MIRTGIIASSYRAAAGSTIVQVKGLALASDASSGSITLDTEPTPGNLLVCGATCGANSWSGGLTSDSAGQGIGGWSVGFASAAVETGASATVTASGMNSNSTYFKRMCVWEIAPAAFGDAGVDATTSRTTFNLGTTTAGIVLVGAIVNSARTFTWDGDIDYEDSVCLFGHTVTSGSATQVITINSSAAFSATAAAYSLA